MTTTATAPLDMTRSELDDLFGASPAGDIPTGRGRGTAIAYPGSRITRPLAAYTRAVLWQGKLFRPESHDLLNLVTPFSRQAIRAEVYEGESWFDGKPCIVLDYSKTSKVARRIRDEIREVRPNEYLGMVFQGAKRLRVYFWLGFE